MKTLDVQFVFEIWEADDQYWAESGLRPGVSIEEWENAIDAAVSDLIEVVEAFFPDMKISIRKVSTPSGIVQTRVAYVSYCHDIPCDLNECQIEARQSIIEDIAQRETELLRLIAAFAPRAEIMREGYGIMIRTAGESRWHTYA